jgi:hypothetical protein
VLAGEVNLINKYKNIKRNVLNCNSNIYFNKQHILKHQKYVQMKMANTSPAATFTSIAKKLSIKDDIKFPHIKK